VPAAKPAAAQQTSAPANTPAKTPAKAKLTAEQTAAMNTWYSGATVVQVGNVSGDVYRIYSDNVAINSGTGSSSLQGDITNCKRMSHPR
jgi:hypothetical protein